MTRRPRLLTQFSLNLNVPPPNVVVPDEVVQALADLLLEAVGARSGIKDGEDGEDGHDPQDHR
jgi:hypothetical protein